MTTSLEIFERQRKRAFGTQNPERQHVEHWEYMVRSVANPYRVCTGLGLKRLYNDRSPDWCFDRFGMTRTPMPDGRVICIAGEHEDSYDPDFCICNDVIVLRPEAGRSEVTLETGEVEIYGYPSDIFAPTDFHSATLDGERILMIGRLGYHGKASPPQTPFTRSTPAPTESSLCRRTARYQAGSSSTKPSMKSSITPSR